MRSTVDWASKGLWLPQADRLAGSDLVAAARCVFDGGFTWPLMVAKRSAIEANIARMAAYCAEHGVGLAPHGKTTMAPTLFNLQLAAGAWGITVATANQALVARRFGIPRVLLANELVDLTPLRWAAQEAILGWDFMCYVDSRAGVGALREALAPLPHRSTPHRSTPAGRLKVFVEMGYSGGRTGCRDVASAVSVARAAAAIDGVEVVGVAGFEGMIADRGGVRRFLATMVAAAKAIAPLAQQPLILSAGGSTYFDLVLEEFKPAAAEHGWQVILRSGAYVTHDDGIYANSSPFARLAHDDGFTAALQVFAQVLSTPERGLAILGAGKRDLPFDEGMPAVKWARSRDGSTRALPGARIERLNDQHAHLRDASVTVGELVCLGISHPCTAFDKWRIIPVVDDSYRIVDLLHTYF